MHLVRSYRVRPHVLAGCAFGALDGNVLISRQTDMVCKIYMVGARVSGLTAPRMHFSLDYVKITR